MNLRLTIVGLVLFFNSAAQSVEFTTAASAFENAEFGLSLKVLDALEAKIGANPRIESLRALNLEQMGETLKAYNSVLRYFKLTGRNNNLVGNADMEVLEKSLKTTLSNELKHKREEINGKRRNDNEEIVAPKRQAMQAAYAGAKQKSDEYYNKIIAEKEFTEEDISIVKTNVETDAAKNLNVNTLKIRTISLSDYLYIGQDENVLIEEIYKVFERKLKTDPQQQKMLKKEKRLSFKTDNDYTIFLKDLRSEIRHLLNLPGGYYQNAAEHMKMNEKYGNWLPSIELPCRVEDAAPFINNVTGTVDASNIYVKDGRIQQMQATVVLSDGISAFTKQMEFNVEDIPRVKPILEKKYGLVEETLKYSTEQERNFAKYRSPTYSYTIKAGKVRYSLIFSFGPYGYENGNRDVIKGYTLRYVYVMLYNIVVPNP